jgi:hypothetical protein
MHAASANPGLMPLLTLLLLMGVDGRVLPEKECTTETSAMDKLRERTPRMSPRAFARIAELIK